MGGPAPMAGSPRPGVPRRAGVGPTPPRGRRTAPFTQRAPVRTVEPMTAHVMTTTEAAAWDTSQPPEAAVRAVAATKVYGRGDTEVRALDEVDLAIPAGRFTAIMGPSGSGKSTLMHVMAGLDTLTSGRVLVGDVDLAGLSDKELTRLRRDRLGFVFQAFNLLPMLSAAENITLPMDLAGRKGRPRVGRPRHRDGRPAGPAEAPPVRAVGRPAAARRRGPGPGRPARGDLRRRAHRQPRLAQRGRDPAASCGGRSTTWARPS